jgi:hypothetical protein
MKKNPIIRCKNTAPTARADAARNESTRSESKEGKEREERINAERWKRWLTVSKSDEKWGESNEEGGQLNPVHYTRAGLQRWFLKWRLIFSSLPSRSARTNPPVSDSPILPLTWERPHLSACITVHTSCHSNQTVSWTILRPKNFRRHGARRSERHELAFIILVTLLALACLIGHRQLQNIIEGSLKLIQLQVRTLKCLHIY